MSKTENKRFLEVGWLLEGAADSAWGAPRPLDLPALEDASGKAVTACPAVLQHEARIYEVSCPADASVSASIDADGGVRLLQGGTEGGDSRITESLTGLPSWRWRHPRRPLIQVTTPYRFVSDDYCFLGLLPPIHDYKDGRWPGLVIAERQRLDLWPRRVIWTFEWHELEQPLELKQGEPLFYLRFEGRDPARSTQLFEAEQTPELEQHLRTTEEVSTQFEKSWSMFRTARQQRPAALIRRKKP